MEDEPIALQYAIVCRGTTCYRAKRPGTENWEFVVKFSWRSDKRRAEGELLRLAKERGVWGVARLFGYQDLDSIANLRQGLQFEKPRWFPSATSGSIGQTQSRTKSIGSKKSRSRSAGLGIGGVTLESSSSGQKRKRHGEVAEQGICIFVSLISRFSIHAVFSREGRVFLSPFRILPLGADTSRCL